MKQKILLAVTVLALLVLIAGCAQKPLEKINAATAAVDSSISEGAEKYLPEEAKKLNDDLNSALAEIDAENTKIFRNYSKAEEMFANVIADAGSISKRLPGIKEAARREAIFSIKEAQSAIDAGKMSIEEAARRRGLTETIEAISIEVHNLEDYLKEVQAQIEREDYLTVKSRAGKIRAKALALSAQLKRELTQT